MKIGRLITDDGIEIGLESSELKEINEYLVRQRANELIAADVESPVFTGGGLDPEDYERVVQAAYFAGRRSARSANGLL